MTRRAARCLIAAALTACTHGEPFTPPAHDEDQPLNTVAFPVRLTYNRGHDQDVSWLPDGSGFLYSFEHYRYREGDWCIGEMPATGGRLRWTMCADTPSSLDSVDAFLAPSAGPGALLAYVHQSAPPARLGPTIHELLVIERGRPEVPIISMPIPYTIPGQPVHSGISQIRWLDSAAFAYRADLVGHPNRDTVRSGRAVVLITMSALTYTRTVVPRTRYATSVAVLGSDEIAYTRGAESVVYAWSRAHDTTRVLWDFGGGIARGLSIAGNRLVAVVGGLASFVFSPAFQDSILLDNGGSIRVVDLATGDVGVIDQFSFYRHPALSPDGRTLIVENPARAQDLFRFELQ